MNARRLLDVLVIALSVSFVAFLLWMLVYAVRNPELTQMQVFLEFKWYWFGFMAGIVGHGWLSRKQE